MKPLYESVKEEKSVADKMFEELGYKKQEGLREINYFFGNDEIIFYKDVKWFSCSKLEEIDFINMQELKAINQKCKELRVDIMCKYYIRIMGIWIRVPSKIFYSRIASCFWCKQEFGGKR